MKLIKTLSLLFFISLIFSCQSQSDSILNTPIEVNWKTISKGVFFSEIDGPKKAIVGDSKITVFKLDPKVLDFQLLSASEFGGKSKTAIEWASNNQVQIVINAGMYSSKNHYLSNKAFMKNYGHYNNAVFDSNYNGMFACNPKDSNLADFKLFDLTCSSWDTLQNQYHSFAQGMRMISCGGKPLSWNKKNQYCSMGICAMDKEGFIYFIFTRSPYTHNEMISWMLRLSIEQAVYLEGGPETSLYAKIGDFEVKKYGSYISKSYPNDLNDHFWKIPNVIGVKVK